VAPPTSEFDRQLRELESEIKRLEREYNLFFTGRLSKLPWDTRAQVEALVKRYDRMHIQNTAERFRFQGLQSRFSAFCELWERNLKQRELGPRGPRGRSGGDVPPPPPVAAAPRERNGTDDPAPPRPSIVALRATEIDSHKVRVMHDQLNKARQAAGEPEVPYDRFQEVVKAQVTKLGKDGAEVAFRVGVQDGRVVFTAKAKKDATDE
jgi:hypothetical protein